MSFSDIELWCFSFVTLFNLQGTRRRLGGGTFFILPHFFELVKYFFQLFSKFLQYFARSAFRFRKLCYFITSAFFCQVLFSTFSKFFSALDSLPASSSRKLDYLTTSASVCQVLFSDSFEPFSLGPPEPRPPLGQLAYYTKSSPLCQYLSGKKLEISRNLSFPVCPCRSESTFHLVFRRNRDLHCEFFLYTFIII